MLRLSRLLARRRPDWRALRSRYRNADQLKAAEQDTLADTIDYVDVNRIVVEEMAIRSKLIEHVGQRILNRMKNELNGIEALKVKITKICPPINGDVATVAILIED